MIYNTNFAPFAHFGKNLLDEKALLLPQLGSLKRQHSNRHKFIHIGPFVQLSCEIQRIVVVQRSKEQGIVDNFVDTTMQRASLSARLFGSIGEIEVSITSSHL